MEPELSAAEMRQFKRNQPAWAFFQAQAPSYRKKLVWWVVRCKQAATRERCLLRVIEACENGQKL